MRTPSVLVSAILAFTSIVTAEFNQFYFSSNATDHACPGTAFACNPPEICAHESVTDQYYCCIPGATDAVCWKASPSCDGGDRRTPSGGQQLCSSGDSAFCCLKSREECTATKNQINICWSTVENLVANLSDTKLNETYSSLSSAQPSASSFPVSLAQLQTTPTPVTSSSSSLSASSLPGDAVTSPSSVVGTLTSTVDTAASSTSTPTSAVTNEDNGTSRGTIGGAVGGVVGGLVIFSIICLQLYRKRKARKAGGHAPVAGESPSPTLREHGNPYELNAHQQQQYMGLAEAPVTEKYASNAGAELADPASPYRDVPEVHGNAVERPVAYEMPGDRPSEMDGSVPTRR